MFDDVALCRVAEEDGHSHSNGRTRTLMKPIWQLTIVAASGTLLRSMNGETERPSSISRSPCWKNSSIELQAKGRWKGASGG